MYSLTCLLALLSVSGVWSQRCLVENFSEGSMGVLDAPCESWYSNFITYKYDTFNETVVKPEGAGDYFAAPIPSVDSCLGNSVPITVTKGTTISFDYYTFSATSTYTYCLLYIYNQNDRIIASDVMFVDNTREWKTSKNKFSDDAQIKITLQCSTLLDTFRAQLVIAKMVIQPPEVEDCEPQVTTMEPTTLIPITPAPPSNCNCVCNCNYYCNKPGLF